MNKENKDATEGCFSLITIFLSLSGLFSIVEGNYINAILFCTPLICWMLFIVLNHNSLKGSDKTMAIASFSLVTLFYTFAGIMEVVYEDYFNSLLLFIPLISCILYVVYFRIFIEPEEKRWSAIRRMYKLPHSLIKEGGEQWGKAFQQLINAKLNNISKSQKNNDLQQCQNIVKKMTKDEAFKDLNRAFRFTGCHFIVTDNNGKVITKIV